MYDEMMESWLRIVVRPLIHKHHHHHHHHTDQGKHQDKDQGVDSQRPLDSRINDTDDPNHHLKKRDRTERGRDDFIHAQNDDDDSDGSGGQTSVSRQYCFGRKQENEESTYYGRCEGGPSCMVC